MLTFSNEELHQTLAESTGVDASHIDFLPFSDLEESVREDMRRIRESSPLARNIEVRGFIYDVKTGLLTEVSSES